MTVAGLVDASLRPFDAARRQLMLGAWHMPWLRRFIARSESRIALQATVSVILLFAVTTVAPGLLFVLGPAVFGVAHIANDVRYLVLRRDLPRAWIVTVVCGCGILLVFRALELALPVRFPFAMIEVGFGWGLALVGTWMGAAASDHVAARRRAAGATILLAATMALAILHPLQARALFAYGHNVVALVLWLVLFRPRKTYALVPVGLATIASVVLIAGATVPWLRTDSPWAPTFIDEALAAARRIPDKPAIGIGLSYVFLQALHYSVWLSWIPQEEAGSGASLTFRMSARAARRDFGRVGLALIVIVAASVILLSFVAVHRTRSLYLSLATFHGYLEIASFAFLATSFRSRRSLIPFEGRTR